MNKDLINSLLNEIVKSCDTIKQIKENSNSHFGLRKLLKSNYEISNSDIESFITSLSAKIKQAPNKQIERLNDKIINLCKLVNISYKEKDSETLNYSKIRSRVSNMKHNLKKEK